MSSSFMSGKAEAVESVRGQKASRESAEAKRVKEVEREFRFWISSEP